MPKPQQCQYDKANVLWTVREGKGTGEVRKGRNIKKRLAGCWCCLAPRQAEKSHTNVQSTWQRAAQHESPSIATAESGRGSSELTHNMCTCAAYTH